MMHGRSKMSATPASDVTMPLSERRCRAWVFFFNIYLFIYFYGFAPTWLRLEPIRPKSGHIGWIRSYPLAIEIDGNCNCNCFYKPNRIRAQTNQVRSHIFEIVNRKTTRNALFHTWWFDIKFSPMIHGCSKMSAIPTSDVMTPLPACWCRAWVFFLFFLPIRANSALISANSAWIGSYWPNQIVSVGN